MPKFDSNNIMIKLQMTKNKIIKRKKIITVQKQKLTRKSVYNVIYAKNKLPSMKSNLLLVMII